jgi:NADH-quinone oxidoreductase subunit H
VSESLPLWVDVFRVLVAFLVFLLTTAVLIWGERRLVGLMQSRLGPNRIGPLGIGQTLIDGVKMFFKEDVTPSMVEKAVFTVAPLVGVIVSFMTIAVIPVGGEWTMFGETFTLQAADLNIGVLWVLAMGSLHVYAVFLAGWASQSPYPLIGGVRSSAQMISYEIAMGLAVASVFIYTGSFRVSDIVAAQAGEGVFPGAPGWFFLPLFPAFAVFVVSMVAEAQRPPFDLAESEGDLVAGFHTEYSGMRFGMFMLSEFMGVVIQSAIVVTLFFGGPSGPVFGPTWLANLLPVVWFMAKTVVFICFFVLLRGSQARARYDKLMNLGWKVMIPAGLVWAMATAALVIADDSAGVPEGAPDQTLAGIVGFALLLLGLFAMPRLARDERARTQLATSDAVALPPPDSAVPVTTEIPPSGQFALTAERAERTDQEVTH